jgi:Kef-type K+ transport system membrane component KefB
VISRIFHDLKILHTRFASLVLGAALLEDIALWAVFAVASAMAANSEVGASFLTKAQESGNTILFLLAGLFVLPALLRRLHDARWNVVRAQSPTGYAALVLLAYAAAAALFHVNMVFAAFLAGFGLVGGMSGSQRAKFAEPLEAVAKVATGVFVPVYFALVGAKLNFGAGFSPGVTAIFLGASSLLCLLSIGLAARLAGFRGIEIINLAVVSNARGGPGIVLASVAYEAGIISGAFFTTLVLTAVLTSQFAGWWLATVLKRGWTLLREDMDDLRPGRVAADATPAAERQEEPAAT